MSNIRIITASEYLRKVRSKGFIIATVLAPLLLLLPIAIAVIVSLATMNGGERTLAILDHTDVLAEEVMDALPDQYKAFITEAPEDSLRSQVRRGDLDGLIIFPAGLLENSDEILYFSTTGASGFSGQSVFDERIKPVVRNARLRMSGVQDSLIARAESGVTIRSIVLTEEGEAADTSVMTSAVGYAMGIIIYMAVLIYGAMVMRSVIEEKSNRIVEVIASSVRPFDLMMGKVLGIGAAGLTQFALWTILLVAMLSIAGPLFFPSDPSAVMGTAEAQEALAATDFAGFVMPPISAFLYFIGFFIGGYLLYSSLFAAVGSAVDNEADAQSLQMPIMIPVILPVVLLPMIADNPDAPVSSILSLIPMFSPILMPVRSISGAAPTWEVLLALVLLVAAFIFAIWIAGRIYRVGILMYGKKVSFRDLARWVWQS